MKAQYVITADHGMGPVYLCSGGGAFSWWTVHESMATKFRNLEEANRLIRLRGGQLNKVKA
jgi:hypothetical protein